MPQPTDRAIARKLNLMPRLLTFFISLLFALLAHAGEIIYLDSSTGTQRLLNADYNQTYFSVQPFVDTQENLAFCGPASMAAILNSLPKERRPVSPQLKPYAYFTQDTFFNPNTASIKSRQAALQSGLTLQQSAEMLRSFSVEVDIVYGDQINETSLRDLVKSSMADQNTRLLINFDRQQLGQNGHGHFSPAAGYDSASDALLILDVAKFKYPPFWVSVPDLLRAMNTIDPDSGKSRGLIRVRGR